MVYKNGTQNGGYLKVTKGQFHIYFECGSGLRNSCDMEIMGLRNVSERKSLYIKIFNTAHVTALSGIVLRYCDILIHDRHIYK